MPFAQVSAHARHVNIQFKSVMMRQFTLHSKWIFLAFVHAFILTESLSISQFMFDDRDYRVKLKLYPAGGFENAQIAIQLETAFK